MRLNSFSGNYGFTGDGGPATNAQFNTLKSLALDKSNNLLFLADSENNRIRVVDRSNNVITTAVGNGIKGAIGNNGPSLNASLNSPSDMVLDEASNSMIISDSGNHLLRIWNRTNGILQIFAGTGYRGTSPSGTPAVLAMFSGPEGMTFDSTKRILYVADTGNHQVKAIDMNSMLVFIIAGDGVSGYFGDSGFANLSRLSFPTGITIDTEKNRLFVADNGNYVVRVIDLNSGEIHTFAGSGTAGLLGDGGLAKLAQLRRPRTVFYDAIRRLLYITDTLNARVRVVNTMNIISTFSGDSATYSGDGSIAEYAQYIEPSFLTVDTARNTVYCRLQV